MSTPDYYSLLNISRNATPDEIKKAFRQKALVSHPDKTGEKSDPLHPFSDIVTAYETLSDPEKKARYDALQAVEVAMQRVRAHRVERHTRFPQAQARRFGPDVALKRLKLSFTLSLEEVFHGATRTVQWSQNGVQESIKIHIPAGWPSENHSLDLEGEGSKGQKYAVEIKVSLEPSSEYTLEGQELVWKLNLYPWDLMLGGPHTLEWFAKSLVIQVPPMSRPGQRLRLKGMGLPSANRTSGDLWIDLELQWPGTLTTEQKSAWEKIMQAYRHGIG